MKKTTIITGITVLGLALSLQTGANIQAKKTEGQLRMEQKQITISLGKTKKVAVTASGKKLLKKLTWKSGNKNIAMVTNKGVVKGKKQGKTKITVYYKNNKKIKASCTVVVKKERTQEKESPQTTATPVVKVPTTTGAIPVTGTFVNYEVGMSNSKLLTEEWIHSRKELQTKFDSKMDYLQQMDCYNDTFFQNHVLYHAVIWTPYMGMDCTVESAVIKQNESGEWICEVGIKIPPLNLPPDSSVACVMGCQGAYLEFDRTQIEGVTKIVVVQR